MTSLEAALRRIDTDLTDAHVPFAVVGGLAVSVRTEPRFTRDADLADLRALLKVASPAELVRARQGLALIADRGFHRGRDLATELNRLLPATD